jgi:hypothetical protein
MKIILQSCYGLFVEGIQAEMHTLEKGVFNYVASAANSDAHVLAKSATTYVIDSTWVEVTPPGICGIIRREGTLSPPPPSLNMFFLILIEMKQSLLFKKKKKKKTVLLNF